MHFWKNAIARTVGVFALVALAVSVTACNRYALAGDWEDDAYVVTADRCKADGWMMIGYTVDEGCEKLVVDSQLEKGTLHVTLGSGIDVEGIDVDAALESNAAETDEDASIEELEESAGVSPDAFNPEETILEIEVTGTGKQEFPVKPGDYSLQIAGDDGAPATGKITITAE